MKTVLWLCNTPLPEIQGMVGIKSYNEGWLIGISNQLRKRGDIEFHYAFRQNRFKKTFKKTIDRITFWGFYEERRNLYEIRKDGVQNFRSIFRQINPDIIHIFGTEYPYALECIYGASDRCKIIVSLQGIMSELARIYVQGIPLVDRLNGRLEGNKYHCILTEQFDFYKRGINEKRVIESVKNVIGRTDWDRRCVQKINPECRYYHCNETLRDVFYEGKWNIENIQRHSVFISQGNYPIKGLHVLLAALPMIRKKYPDVKVYVAGNKDFIERDTPYGVYIQRILKKYHIEENVIFLGTLTDEKMKARLLNAHVMLMPSLLENSPNSIGEAMLLGTPVVASRVGGIPSMLKSGKEGYLYSVMDREGIARRVCRIFDDDNLAMRFSENGRMRAAVQYDRSRNAERLLEIYDKL